MANDKTPPTPTPPPAGSPLAAGAALQALPMDHLIAAPLLAAIGAQVRSSKMYADWISQVGLDANKKAVTVDFEYKEDQIGTDGKVTGSTTRRMQVPLLALLHHPAVNLESASVDFEMTVETSEAEHASTAGEGGFDAKVGWGPFSVKVHGKVSHKSEQTRKTDTRSKYSFHVEMKYAGPTEAMSRIIEHMTDASVRPSEK